MATAALDKHCWIKKLIFLLPDDRIQYPGRLSDYIVGQPVSHAPQAEGQIFQKGVHPQADQRLVAKSINVVASYSLHRGKGQHLF